MQIDHLISTRRTDIMIINKQKKRKLKMKKKKREKRDKYLDLARELKSI